jgi:hypothetical protein
VDRGTVVPIPTLTDNGLTYTLVSDIHAVL